VTGGGTLTAAIFGIIKGTVGPGVLYVPHGFATSGWAFAVPMLIFSLVMFIFSASNLVRCWWYERARFLGEDGDESYSASGLTVDYRAGEEEGLLGTNSQSHSNGDNHNGRKKRTFKSSYPALVLKAFGESGSNWVKVGIMMQQFGIVLIYFIFVPKNLHKVCLDLFDVDVPIKWLVFVMVLVELPLSWLKDIRRLASTNMFANFLILYGLLCCLGFAFLSVGEASDYSDDTGSNSTVVDDDSGERNLEVEVGQLSLFMLRRYPPGCLLTFYPNFSVWGYFFRPTI